MDNQYPFSNSRERSQYNMLRTLQSPAVGGPAHGGHFEGMGGDMQGREMQRSSLVTPNTYVAQNSYGSHHQLPPLNTRDPAHGQQGGGYGSMPPRPAHSTPASAGMGYPSSYMPHPPFSAAMTQQYSSTAPLPYPQPQHMGMQGGMMQYHGDYAAATTGMADFRGMTATTHGQSMPDAMAPQYHMSPGAEHELGPRSAHLAGAQPPRRLLPGADGQLGAGAGPGAAKASKNTAVPPKDENGKYPCPCCTKNYLHAKHLKRHMLRRKFRAARRDHAHTS